ncbi:32983_t:CDS:2, partial [Racocetra persica]
QKDSATVGDPREIPTDKELEFLKETEKLVNKYTKDYILQFEELRTCYTQEYLDELERFVKHLENKLDLTRKGYELYKPVDFKKVDEFKTLIHLGRDFVAE